MKLYGYSDQGLPHERIEPEALAEVTLVADSAELRKIAASLVVAAENMEQMGSSYSHEHLADQLPEFEGSPHFVVFSPEAAS